MAALVAVPSMAAVEAVSSSAFAGVAASAAPVPAFGRLLHSFPSPTAARARPPRHRLLPPPAHLSAPLHALPACSRLVAAFNPSIAPVTKMTSTAAGAAASWAAAVFAPAPHAATAAAAAPPSLSAIAITATRMLLELVRTVAERVGADLSAPWTAAVSGAGRCLELYREIMLVRCLLTWFPNVPWERQPFSAMRDLCDPFLRLFQRIVPPVFGNTLDISSLLAFTALGVLARLMSPATAVTL
ncbi:hypothetical protein Taro_012517 [Colocasia esculenta]|uniref:YGGT family protein n=1 Tax=Colocasia esculenta TaxID=4460 RepID=A0A843U9D7_COLES|nr:hypothetical protein [Colocasia esculenta]